jgi:hypothetical protein
MLRKQEEDEKWTGARSASVAWAHPGPSPPEQRLDPSKPREYLPSDQIPRNLETWSNSEQGLGQSSSRPSKAAASAAVMGAPDR